MCPRGQGCPRGLHLWKWSIYRTADSKYGTDIDKLQPAIEILQEQTETPSSTNFNLSINMGLH